MVKTLLRNFINQEKCPSELYKNTTDSVSAIASATASLACKLFAFLVIDVLVHGLALTLWIHTYRYNKYGVVFHFALLGVKARIF